MYKTKKQKTLTIGLFMIYFITLVGLVLFKLGMVFTAFTAIRSVNLVPFGASLVIGGRIFTQEIASNILVFIPLGVYVYIFKPNWPLLKKIIPCVGLSVLLEVLQYIFAIGASDITDVIGNTLGGIIGIGLYGLLKRIFKNRALTIVNGIASIASVVALLLLMNLIANSFEYITMGNVKFKL